MNPGDTKAPLPPVSQHFSMPSGCGRRVAYEITLTSTEPVQGLIQNRSSAMAMILPLLLICCLKQLPTLRCAETQSGVEETTQSFLRAWKKKGRKHKPFTLSFNAIGLSDTIIQ